MIKFSQRVSMRRSGICGRISTVCLSLLVLLLSTEPAPSLTPSGAYLKTYFAAHHSDYPTAAEGYLMLLDWDKQNSNFQRQSINFSVAAGRMDKAIELAKQSYAKDDTDGISALILAVDDIVGSRYQQAITKLRKTEEDGTDTLVTRFLYSWALVGDGKNTEAEESLRRIASRPGFDALVGYHVGLIRMMTGDAAGAVQLLNETNERTDGTYTLIRNTLARAHLMMGEKQQALDILNKIIAEDDQNIAALEALENIESGVEPAPPVANVQQGASESMLNLAGLVVNESSGFLPIYYLNLALYLYDDSPRAMVLLGELLESWDRWQQAADIFDKVPKGTLYYPSAILGKVHALESMNHINEAVEILDNELKSESDRRFYSIAYGDLLRRHERYDEAVKAYDVAIELSDESNTHLWSLYYARGVCHERGKNWPLAEADFLKALEIKPRQPLVQNYLGYSWIEMGQNLERARVMIEDAVSQRPTDGYIVDSLGWALYQLADYEEAVKYLRRAVELLPVDPTINDHYGDALWMVNRRLEARFQWKRALSFEEEGKDLGRIKNKLKNGLDFVLRQEMAEKSSEENQPDSEQTPAEEGVEE